MNNLITGQLTPEYDMQYEPGFSSLTACELWDRQMKSWQACQEKISRPGSSTWETEAGALRYWNQTWQFQKERISFLLSRLMPLEGKNILDIGSGPGVLSIPFSLAGARVTAVDRSSAMLRVLKMMARQHGARTITIVHQSWENIKPEAHLEGMRPYDLVLCSLSLIMPDIKQNLLKMREVCRGEIHLIWPRARNHWSRQLSSLYPVLYGFDYRPKPGAELLVKAVEELIQNTPVYNKVKNEPGELKKPSHGKTSFPERPEKDSDSSASGQQAGLKFKNESLKIDRTDELLVEELEFTYREEFSDEQEALQHFREYFGLSQEKQILVLNDFLRNNLRRCSQKLILEHPLPLLHLTWKCRT